MPIILVLLLSAACARVPWPEPPFGLGAAGSLALTAAALLLPLGATAVLSRWAAAAVRAAPRRRSEVAARYGRLRRLFGYALLLAGVLAVAGLGWGWTVWHRAVVPFGERSILAPMAELLVPAPYLLAVFAAWVLHYDAEKAFHDASVDGVRAFWSRPGHFVYNLRPFAFLVLAPVTLVAGQQTFARLAPAAADHWIAQAAGLALVPVLFVFMPLLVKPALGLKPLPPGPTRARLEELARRLHFRYTDLLLWHTRGGPANAMVVGVVPWARYVVFTDALLDALAADEVDAVFGHEVGHVRHRHIPYYAGFLVLSVMVTAGAVAVGLKLLADAEYIDPVAWQEWLAVLPLAVLGGYVFLVFGFLSRKCERQADLFGCRAADPAGGVTPAGIAAMARALERVAAANGMDARPSAGVGRVRALLRAWQHGSIGERVEYLLSVAADPDRERAFQRRVFALRCGLMAGLVAALLALGYVIGWDELAKAM
jgi:Zn-dependent protease with chaperone function